VSSRGQGQGQEGNPNLIEEDLAHCAQGCTALVGPGKQPGERLVDLGLACARLQELFQEDLHMLDVPEGR